MLPSAFGNPEMFIPVVAAYREKYASYGHAESHGWGLLARQRRRDLAVARQRWNRATAPISS